MKTLHHITYCGMDAHGPTVKDARQAAAIKIEAALKADYEPRVLSHGGHQAIIWNTPFGVRSAMIHDGDRIGGWCLESRGFEAVVHSKRAHLAQLALDPEHDTTDELPGILKPCPGPIQRDYITWRAWQRAFKDAPDSLTNVEKHQWASDHAADYTCITRISAPGKFKAAA